MSVARKQQKYMRTLIYNEIYNINSYILYSIDHINQNMTEKGHNINGPK